jgi:hypothetical protein
MHPGAEERWRDVLQRVDVSVHTIANFDNAGPKAMSMNHATIYLVLPEERSVRLDMSPINDKIGTLVVEALQYENSKSVIKRHTTPPAPNTTVGDFWKVIEDRKLYAFMFEVIDGGYFGCREWVYVL